jgi:hypothetical protein
MAKGYLANNKKTPQGVTNVEVILFNHLMQKRMERILFFLNGRPKDLQLKDYCHELC